MDPNTTPKKNAFFFIRFVLSKTIIVGRRNKSLSRAREREREEEEERRVFKGL